jgi:hypothetical protein
VLAFIQAAAGRRILASRAERIRNNHHMRRHCLGICIASERK